MARIKVLIVDCEFLFDECVEKLLGALDAIEITRMDPAVGVDLYHAVALVKPDILIFDATRCNLEPARFFELLESNQVKDRIIIVDATGDLVQIYKKEQIKLKEVKDFLKLFQPVLSASELS